MVDAALRWATMGDAPLVEEDVPGRGSQIRGWSNCVSLATFVLGRSYCVWSPNGLFRRLLAEARTERVDIADFVEACLGAQPGGYLAERTIAAA
jgi:hypothetical protein